MVTFERGTTFHFILEIRSLLLEHARITRDRDYLDDDVTLSGGCEPNASVACTVCQMIKQEVFPSVQCVFKSLSHGRRPSQLCQARCSQAAPPDLSRSQSSLAAVREGRHQPTSCLFPDS